MDTKYVNSLLEKHNFGANDSQRNLVPIKKYYTLFNEVNDLLKKYPDHSIEEIRNMLFEGSNVAKIVQEYVYNNNLLPGIVCSYGTNLFSETIIAGNKKEVIYQDNHLISEEELMDTNTIFDLASVTKLFTSISILKLKELKILKLNDLVTKYVPEFKNLNNITIFDLLSFKVPLKTSKRIDEAIDKYEAETILYNIQIDDSEYKYRYSDMGAMILKYVIERAANMDYYSFLNEYILKPIEMNNTKYLFNNSELNRIAATGLDYKIYDDKTELNKRNVDGLPYDPKAIAMGHKDGNLCGHSGLFSTAGDMTTLAKELISNNIITKYDLTEMGKSRIDYTLIPGTVNGYNQAFGYLVYSKNPSIKNTEVNHILSGRSFASAGWTGTKFILDPENKIYCFFGSNRSHNRVTFISEKAKVNIIKKGKSLILPDNRTYIDATRYAYDKDIILDEIINLAFKYKILEDIINMNTNEILEYDKKERHI